MVRQEIRDWCGSDHGSAIGSWNGDTCRLERLLSHEEITVTDNHLQMNLVSEGGEPIEAIVDRSDIVDVNSVGGDLDIETTDGTIRVKRDRRY